MKGLNKPMLGVLVSTIGLGMVLSVRGPFVSAEEVKKTRAVYEIKSDQKPSDEDMERVIAKRIRQKNLGLNEPPVVSSQLPVDIQTRVDAQFDSILPAEEGTTKPVAAGPRVYPVQGPIFTRTSGESQDVATKDAFDQLAE